MECLKYKYSRLVNKVNINSETDLYCIFGKPVRHSFSPLMHNAAFQELGYNAVYLAFEPDTIEQAIASMRTLGIRGASITIPFKVDAMKFVDTLDPLAKEIGAINTIHISNDSVIGYNTDGIGALRALKDQGVDPENSSVLILGNGGSARSIAFTLLEKGAAITIAGRNMERVNSLAKDLRKRFSDVTSTLIKSLQSSCMDTIDIIVNTTSVGMDPEVDSIPLDGDLITGKHIVFDIVYKPDITRLLKTAQEKGCTVVRGVSMLVHQGAQQFEIWTGQPAPVETMYRIIHNYLSGNPC